ncbi:hypothetical protein K445DRAFT_26595 [Daldinia sp. EC12]|nr:hypothetical protein K445DRAFT_26595 [Daldinia sp. EC12]
MAPTEDKTQLPLDYSNSGPGIIVGSYVLALITTIIVALRCWARRLTSLPLGLDDYLILSCLLMHHLFVCFCTLVVIRGGLGRDMRIVAQDPSAVVALFKFLFMAEISYAFSCTLVKLSVLAFYLKIFPTRTVRVISTTLGLISISWTIAMQVVNLLQCRPLKAFWYRELQQLPTTKCIDIILYFVGNSISNCVVDFCTIVVPVQEVLKLQISRSRKIGVCAIFLLSGIAFAASLTRTLCTAQMYKHGTHNFSKQFVAPGLATIVEVYVAIVGACLPTLIPVYRKLRYAHPNSAKRAASADEIITVGDLSNRVRLGAANGGYFDRVSGEGEFALTPYCGNFQVNISSQDNQLSLPADSLELSLQGIIVKQNRTWSDNTKPLG